MKKILLISNEVLHYREKIYNNFYYRFLDLGYELNVASDSFQGVYPHEFISYAMKSLGDWEEIIEKVEPDCVIMFLHLKDLVMFPLVNYCRKHGIAVIYWGHGINIADKRNVIKNAIFHYIHSRCDALITYTPLMIENFRKQDRDKAFVAFNTQDFSDIKKEDYNPSEIRKKYGITQPLVISYVSRMKKYKRPEYLLDVFGNEPNIAIVFVGPGMDEGTATRIASTPNAYYLGELYDKEVNEIFSISDAFSTPGHIGLALNQSFFWGVPVFLLEGVHAPEIYYMKDGDTGIISSEAQFKQRALAILNNKVELNRMKKECLKVYSDEIDIEKMFVGFSGAVDFALSQRGIELECEVAPSMSAINR